MSKAIFILLLLAVLASGCAQYGTQPSPPAQANAVNIQNYAFSPAEITITKGTTVTWTNLDTTPHTVTGSSFDSGTLQKGQSWSYTFNDAGTFDYICSIHPAMKGKVMVRE